MLRTATLQHPSSQNHATTNHNAMLSHNRLDLDFTLSTLLLLPLPGLGLRTHDATSPVAPALLILFDVALLDCGDDLGEFRLVFAADFGYGESGGGLSRYVSRTVNIA